MREEESLFDIPPSINNMVENNQTNTPNTHKKKHKILKWSRLIPLNNPAEHPLDRKSPSALTFLKLGNTHEYFIKLLLFKHKSRQNALAFLPVNGDSTRFCWTALLLCVRKQGHQLQQCLRWVTAATSNASRNLMFPPWCPLPVYSILQCYQPAAT